MATGTLAEARGPSRHRARGRGRFRNWVVYAALGAAVVYTLFPILWMISNSVKKRGEIMASPVVWITENPTLVNYVETFIVRDFFDFMMNSLVVAISVTAISLTCGTFTAYGLARFTYFGSFKKHLSFWILSTRMIPPIVTILPLYILFQNLGLLDSKLSLIITYTGFNLPFVVWMMKGYFSEIPPELEESAMVDGDTRLGAMFRIALPLAKPSLAATAIFSFILSWNEMLIALILADTSSSTTLPIGIAGRVTQFRTAWGEISAAGFISIIPIIIFAFVVQRHLVRGLSFGAVKG